METATILTLPQGPVPPPTAPVTPAPAPDPPPGPIKEPARPPACPSVGAIREPRTDDSPQSVPTHGWFKAMRDADVLELIRKNPNAYVVATIIAHRARWHEGFNADGLGLGEALIGDYKAYGMTRQEYRTALAQLRKWNFATARTTNRGTIARLTDTRLFDVLNLAGNQQTNQRATISQPPTNH